MINEKELGKGPLLKDTIELLVEQQEKMCSTSVHFKMEDIFNKEGLTAVISIYKDVNPSNEILDKVYEYAEKNNPELAKYIEYLEREEL